MHRARSYVLETRRCLFKIPCPKCGFRVEFMKYDVKRKCRRCGHEIVNPKINFGCAEWCPYGDPCIEGLP